MEDPQSTLRRSIRRSRNRCDGLLGLDAIKEGYAADIARAAGLRPDKIPLLMIGDDKDYRRALGLINLGLAMAEIKKDGVRYRITPRGRALARSIRRELIGDLLRPRRART